MRQVAQARAAEFFLDRDPVQPDASHLGPQVARKLVAAVDLLGARRDLVLRERLHGLAQLVDLVAETKIEAGPRIGDHRRHLVARLNIFFPVTDELYVAALANVSGAGSLRPMPESSKASLS
jgi:hypothetical protein